VIPAATDVDKILAIYDDIELILYLSCEVVVVVVFAILNRESIIPEVTHDAFY